MHLSLPDERSQTCSKMEIESASYLFIMFASCVPCRIRQVMVVLRDQQAANQQQELTTKTLGDVRRSYLNSMDILASAIGQEVQKATCSFLVEIWRFFLPLSCCTVVSR